MPAKIEKPIYLFVDTDIFVQCCRLERDGDDEISIDTLLKILDENRCQLILPEVVKKEFFKQINERSYHEWADNFKKSHSPLRELAAQSQSQTSKTSKISATSSTNNYNQKLENRCQDNFDKFLDEQVKLFKKTQSKIEKIFAHRNTKLITFREADLFVAYQAFLSGIKPTKSGNAIQSDAVTLAGISRYLKNKKGFRLIICSHNCNDFAADGITSDKGSENSVPVHRDVADQLNGDCELYLFLSVVLNKVFGVKLKIEEDKTEEIIDTPKSEESKLVGLSK